MTGIEGDPALSQQANLLAMAPPGCGKTELLARRAVHLVGSLQPHQRILALTFSNRATKNLRERLLGALGAQRFRRQVKVTNFHGHAAEIIRAHGRTIGLDPNLPLPERSTLSAAIAVYTEGLGFDAAANRRSAIETALSEAKRTAVDDDQVAAILAATGNSFAQEIEAERRANGLLHYDDLLRHAHRILKVDAVAHLYQMHYGVVLVDEFQDLSLQQLDIALASCATSRTFVGDPLQGIYSWAGARPAEVAKRLEPICGPPRRLTTSYRSSPAVLGLINKVSAALGGEPLTAAYPESWPEGGAAVSAVFSSGQEEAQWIVDTATKILAGNPSATIGVITRAGWRREPIDAAFAGVSVPPSQRWDLAIQDSDIVQRLIAAVRRLPRKADMSAVQQTVLADIGPNDVETVEHLNEALVEFEQLVRKAGTPIAAINQLRVPGEDAAVEPGVHLLNAHTGKGQQFDWVFAPGLEGFHIPSPRARTIEQMEEELRVFLVLLSRARHGIVITRAESLVSKRTGNPWSPSPSPWWSAAVEVCPWGPADLAEHLRRTMGGA